MLAVYVGPWGLDKPMLLRFDFRYWFQCKSFQLLVMDPNNLLLWIAGISSATALLQVVRAGAYGSASRKVFSAFVLAVAGAGWFAFPTTAGYVAGGCWCVLLLAPSLISRRLNRLVTREDYKGAASIVRWVKRLYPFDDCRTLVDTYTALALAKNGSRDRAAEILNRYRHVNMPAARAAVAQLYKMEERWQEFIAWADEKSRRRSSSKIQPSACNDCAPWEKPGSLSCSWPGSRLLRSDFTMSLRIAISHGPVF